MTHPVSRAVAGAPVAGHAVWDIVAIQRVRRNERRRDQRREQRESTRHLGEARSDLLDRRQQSRHYVTRRLFRRNLLTPLGESMKPPFTDDQRDR